MLDAATGDLEPLWIAGLALLCVYLGSLLWGTGLGLEGEGYEWAIYLTLGTIFPALLLIIALPNRFSQIAPRRWQMFRLALALLCLVVSIPFIIRQHQYTALTISIAHLLLLIALNKRANLPLNPVSILVSFFVIVIAWTVSARLLWWDSFGAWFFSGGSTTETIYRFLICGLSLLLVFVNLTNQEKAGDGATSRMWTVLNIFAVLIIGVASVRSDQLFNTMSNSHWSVFVGPAEMVRQGGWLLWDVPSQYGFLNILLIAFSPFKSVWQATYFINSFLLFASAIFLFYVLRSVRTGLLNFCFALLVTLAAVFLIAGWPPALLGPQVFPSLGPFRFIWCYVLLFILVVEFRRDSKRLEWQLPLIGCVVWLIGTLWSSESAVYCAAIWLPAYALIVYRKARQIYAERESMKSCFRAVAFPMMIPPVLLALSIGLITVYYTLRLGHAPDWRGFFEYSLSFANGFFAIPIEAGGAVWTLFLIFCAFSTVAAYFLRFGLTHRAASLIAGTWGALWSVTSYFVSRSHPNNATVLAPIFCVVIALTLYLLANAHRQTEWWATLVKMSFVPVLTILLTATFGNASFLGLYLSSPKLTYERNIDTHLPLIDPSLQELLNTAGVKADDPIIYSAVRVKAIEPLADGLSHDHGVLLPAWPINSGQQLISTYRAWLPTTPFVLFAPLPEERRQTYMRRFTARTRLSGWLIQNRKEASYTSSRWFYNQIIRTHTPTKVFENNDWQVIWFEFKPAEHE